MSIYGADSERSLEPPGEKLDLAAVAGSSVQHGPGAMSYPNQEPGLPSDLWYNPGPPQPPTHPPPQPSLVSELPFLLPEEQMPPGSFTPVPYSTHQSQMFPPQYIKQEPGVISEHIPSFTHPQFIKQEPGILSSTTAPHTLSRPDLANQNGTPHMQPLDMGLCSGDSRHPGQVHPHHHPPQHHHHHQQHHHQQHHHQQHHPQQQAAPHGQFGSGPLPMSHVTMPGSTSFSHSPTAFVKQEPGLSRNSMHPSQGGPDTRTSDSTPGPLLHVKQEPGMLGHIKQEPGTPHSFHGDSFYEHPLTPFPSKPINFNFMADIEDIVQPINSEISINRLKCELAGYEGPYGCYGLSMADTKELEMMHMKREEEPIWEPPLWRQQYDNIRNMRSKRDAPVDKYGCFMNAERDVGPQVRRYQVLVSLMLSSQTKDEVVSKAMTKLKENGLTVENVLDTPQEEIARMIFPVGFWNKKAEYIKKTTKMLQDKFKSDIPNSVEGLVSLPGIGPKMAHLIMDFAWGEVSGIAVDTHVHRITHRLGWMPREARSPEEARKILERWFPKSEWSDLNLLFVGFGQQVCSPVGPKCSECMNKDLCPSSSCGVSTGLPLGLGIEVSTKSKGKRGSKSNSTKPKKVKVES